MKKAGVIGLILLVLLVGLPLAMGMSGMEPCPSCSGTNAPMAGAMCLAILSFFVLVVSRHSSRVNSQKRVLRPLFLADSLDRPPRSA